MAVIYGLVHLASLKAYIGCTAGKLPKRFREHKCLLNHNKHKEPDLQRDWLLYGADAFKIGVLETLQMGATVAEKREAEVRWMNALDAKGLLYNRHKISFGFTLEATKKGIEAARYAGRPVSEEGRMRRRMAQLGVPKNHGHKISATKRRNRMLQAT